MPAKFTKTYTSEAEYMYDQAVSTDLFDQTTYEELAKIGRAEDFTYGIAGTKTKQSNTFDKSKYNLLQGEDKLDYLLLEYYTEDKNTDAFKTNEEYFNRKVEEAIDAKVYENLNTLEKVAGTVGGFIGSSLNEILGIGEGLFNAAGFLYEGLGRLVGSEEMTKSGRDFVLQDTTGYNKNREALDKFVRSSTYIDKSKILSGMDEVLKSIVQMTPNIAGYALAPFTGGFSARVGNWIYYGSMAGRGIEEELNLNPDINYGKLFGYAATSTAIEVGTEKISAYYFGDTFVDALFGMKGRTIVGNALSKTGLSVLTEGLEEAVAEVFNSMAYTLIVDHNAPLASFKDVLNAAIIGGITGGVMELGGVGLSKRYVATKDGRLLKLSEAKAEGLTKNDYTKISKFETSSLFNELNNYQEEIEAQSDLDKLKSKYNTTSETELEEKHNKEYKAAVESDLKRQQIANEISLRLATLMEKIGVQDFTNAVKLLEDTETNRRNRILQYADDIKYKKFGDKITQQGALEFSAENPGHSISTYNNSELTNNEKYIAGEIEKAYGKKAMFVDFGSKTGEAMSNVSASKNFVFIEKGLVDKTSTKQVIETVVKQQLVNEIVNTPGLITSKDFRKLFEAVMPRDATYEQLKTKMKSYLMENALFDDVCNRRILRMSFPLFAKLFNKITKSAYETAPREFVGDKAPRKFIGDKETRRVKFNTLLKIRKRFLNNVEKALKTKQDIENATRILSLSKAESQELSTRQKERVVFSDRYVLTTKRLGRTQADFIEFCDEIKYMFKPEELAKTDGQIVLERLLDRSYYKQSVIDDYVTSPEHIKGRSFESMIWNFAESYGLIINPKTNKVYTKLWWTDIVNPEFEHDLYASHVPGKGYEHLSKYKSLKDILSEQSLDTLLFYYKPEDIKIEWVEIEDPTTFGYTSLKNGVPKVHINRLANNTTMAETILHEFVHGIAVDNGDIPTGSSVDTTRIVAEKMSTDDLIDFANKMYDKEEVKTFKTRDQLIEKVAYGMYWFDAGEEIARSMKHALDPDMDAFYIFEDIVKKTVTFTGTGQFAKVNGKQFSVTLTNDEYYSSGISQAKVGGLQAFLMQKGVRNYTDAGFSTTFMGELATNPKINKSDIVKMLNRNEIGSEEATNLVIEYYWQDNENIKTMKDVNKWLKDDKFAKRFSLFDLAYAYYFRHINDKIEDSEGNLIAVDTKKQIPLRKILLDVIADKIENNKPIYSKEKIKENRALFAAAKDLTEKELNKNNLVSALLDEDLDTSLKSIGDFISKLQKGLSWGGKQNDIDVVSSTIMTGDDEEFSLQDTQAYAEWSEAEQSSGERKVELTAKSLKENQTKAFADMLSRTGKSEKGFEELDSMINIKQRLEENALSNIMSEEAQKRLLELYTNPETFNDALMEIYTDENGYSIHNKITKTFKDRLIGFYGQDGYAKITQTLKELVPEEKSNTIKRIKSLKEKAKNIKTLTNDEKLLARETVDNFTPNQMKDYVEKMTNLLEKYSTKKSEIDTKEKTITDIRKEIKNVVSEKAPIEKRTPHRGTDAESELVENATETQTEKASEEIVEPTVVETVQEASEEQKQGGVLNKEEKPKAVKKNEKPTHGELDKETREKAKKQEKTLDKLPSGKTVDDKFKTLLGLMSSDVASEYQGDFEDPRYVVASGKIIENNRQFFDDITADEYQALRAKLLAEDTLAGDAALNLLLRYAYDNRYSSNLHSIAELIMKQHKRLSSFSGQFLAGLSATYGHHTVTSFIQELESKTGVKFELNENDVVDLFPQIGSYSEYENQLRNEIDNLNEKFKKTKDAFEKNKIKHQIDIKTQMLDAILDNDASSLIDSMTQEMLEQDHDQYVVQEKISNAYRKLVEKVVTQEINKINSPSVVGKGKFDKLGTGKFFDILKGLNSFRYLAMLSSPSTAIKNAFSNTGVAALSIVEDKVGGWLQNKDNWFLNTETQIKFNGQYTEEFSKYVDEKYGAKINAETEGNKYTQSKTDILRQEYAKAKDPLKKSKILSKIKEIEEKALSDKKWTQPKALKNLKNMLAGAAPQILLQAEQVLQNMYKAKTYDELVKKIEKTNPELASLYRDCYSNSDTSTLSILKLGEEINVPLLDPANKDNIINVALYRANKMFFKVDNWLTKLRKDLQKTHPGAVALLDFVIPFARTTINTTGYIIDRSPIGLAKGIVKTLQTRQMQLRDMAGLIEGYYKNEFKKTKDKDYIFVEQDFVDWFNNNAPKEIQQALNGDKKSLVALYDKMVADGKIPRGLVMTENPYARAYAIEAVSEGVVGTAVMALGFILAAILDNFDYEDDDDYLGPIIRLGDLKIALDSLSPFTTMFTMGAMLGSKNIDDKFKTMFETFTDNTVFGIIGSAIKYSDNLSDFVKNQSITTLQQFIPSLFKTITKTYSAKKDKSGNYFEKLWKTTASNIPLLSELVPNKVNPYTGEIEKNYEAGFIEGLTNALLPWGRVENKSEFEKEAERLDNKTNGLAGWFEINGIKYELSGDDKERYGVYKANYIKNKYDRIVNGKEKVTVTTKDGKRKTTTYDKLTDEEKQNALDQIYSEGSSYTRIKYWLDTNNTYITSNYDEYVALKKTFPLLKIRYNKTWKKSKFVKG
jgi:predicted esterase YcpF (UPF0227 family)